MPKISVIVPVHNTEKFLGKCLNSLVSQTTDDIEFILIDDASTDNSLEILSSYQSKYPDKIKVISLSKNQGTSVARNKGLELATGAYIGFVDSDDYISPVMYEKLLKKLETTSADIARTNYVRKLFGINLSKMRRHSNEIKDAIIIPSTHPDFLIQEPPGVTNKLFKREVIGDRKFVPGLKWEDYPFTVPLLVFADQIATTEESHYFYIMNLHNTTLTDARKLNKNLLDIFDCSDMIGNECFQHDISDNVRKQLEYVQVEHCLVRLKEVAGANIPLQEKRELLTLLSELIKTKYFPWQDDERYLAHKARSFIHRTRMNIVESLILPPDTTKYDEGQLKQKIKTKLEKNAK